VDFAEIFRVLRRRWRVSVPALLIAVLATVGMYRVWPTTYQSSAVITLLGPRSLAAQPGNGNNPFIVVGDLDPMATILASYLSTPQALGELQALNVNGTFTAAVPAFAAGPFVTLTLAGKNRAAISRSMPVVIRFAERRLRTLQENSSIKTPANGVVGSTVIAAPNAPTPVRKKKIELVAAVAILGLVAVLILSFSAEALAIRRGKGPDRASAPAKARVPGRAEKVDVLHSQDGHQVPMR